MDDARLQAIKARADAATVGPWRWADWMIPFGETEDDDMSKRRWLEACAGGEAPRYVSGDMNPDLILVVDDPVEHAGNRAFIAHAREDVPGLIAALEASRAECAQLRVALGDLGSGKGVDQCWCSPDMMDAPLHEHEPECWQARAALNGAADATVGSEPTDEPIPGSRQAFIKAMQERG